MKSLLSIVKKNLKNQSSLMAKLLGINLLNFDSTRDFFSRYLIKHEEEKLYTLPVVYDKVIFPKKEIVTPETYVWKYDNRDASGSLLKNGSISINKSVIDTDFGNIIVLKDSLKISKRNKQNTKLLIAPWSHYWSGYYDYIFFVIAKLVRMKQVVSDSYWKDAVVSYPIMHSTFERELLSIIGFRPEQIVDSRTTKVEFETCLIGNNSSWFYPNSADILLLRDVFWTQLKPNETANKRIYISRSGRRQVNDEPALIDVLRKHQFTIIEDKARTIEEQAEIYRSASVIIGPHGASFANILWCKPGTHLIELFPAKYMPEYFRYLAHILDLKYSAYCFHPVLEHGLVDHSHVNDNVDVKIEDIDRFLSSLP
jgi:hypothetical protein